MGQASFGLGIEVSAGCIGTREESALEGSIVRSRSKHSLHCSLPIVKIAGPTLHGFAVLLVEKEVAGDFYSAEEVDFVGGETGAITVATALFTALPVAVVTKRVLEAGENGGLLASASLLFLHLLDLLEFFALVQVQ